MSFNDIGGKGRGGSVSVSGSGSGTASGSGSGSGSDSGHSGETSCTKQLAEALQGYQSTGNTLKQKIIALRRRPVTSHDKSA